MDTLSKLEKLIGRRARNDRFQLFPNWRISGVLVVYFPLHWYSYSQKFIGDCIKIYYRGMDKKIKCNYHASLNEACRDEIYNLMLGHKLP